MQYWRGAKQTEKESHHVGITPFKLFAGPDQKSGPSRKLSLEQEILLTLMKLRLALLYEDLAFRFQVSLATVSSIFITWIKLMSKELSVLIIWPSRSQTKKTLPGCFRKLFPKVRCIIDCFECFTETPSALDLAATMWSEYKHHYTLKVLVAITPVGAIYLMFFPPMVAEPLMFSLLETVGFQTLYSHLMKSWQIGASKLKNCV